MSIPNDIHDIHAFSVPLVRVRNVNFLLLDDGADIRFIELVDELHELKAKIIDRSQLKETGLMKVELVINEKSYNTVLGMKVSGEITRY